MKQLLAVNSSKINKHIFSFVVPFVLDGKQVKCEIVCVSMCVGGEWVKVSGFHEEMKRAEHSK